MPSNEKETKEIAAKPEPSDAQKQAKNIEEIGGPKGLEPTRYGDWEQAGRCTDF